MNGQYTNIEVIVGRNIKAAREALEWKQSELAERTGIARSTIAKIENGGASTASTLSVISDAFGIPPYMLMLRSIDCKRLANVATCQSKIEKFQASGKDMIDPADVERIQEMSSSTLKKERHEAVTETNAVVARIFGISRRMDDADIREAEKSRMAGTGIVTKLLPSYPIINGLIANLITA